MYMSIGAKIKDRILDLLYAIVLWIVMWWDDIFDIIKTVVLTYLACLICFTFFFKPVLVDGSSMYPTIMDKSIGFSSVITKKISGIKRFDVVTIQTDEEDKKLIKRVIGLPNETIKYIDEVLYVNDVEIDTSFLDKQYMREMIEEKGYFTKDGIWVLGEDEYFCMGDNRCYSADSRTYGAFSSEQILSVGLLVLYPFSNIGIVK